MKPLMKRNWIDFFSKNYVWFFLSIILIMSVSLRLYKLDFKSLWLDELYTVATTHPQSSVNFIIDYCRSDQPPFYFLVIHYWFKIFGYSSFVARLFSVLIGVLGVLAMYFLGKEIKNQQTGIIASFLTCINYFQIYYSQEARFYSMLFLLTVISFLFFIRGLKYKTIPNYVCYVLATVALLYTQYFGLLIFLIQGLAFIGYVIVFNANRKFIFVGMLLAVIIAVSFLPWIPTLIYDSNISSYWIERPKFFFPLVYFYIYWGKDFVSEFLLVVAGLVYLRYLIGLVKKSNYFKEDVFFGAMLIGWIVVSYAIPYIRSVISTPMLIPRYTLIALPAIIIILAMGVQQLSSHFRYGVLAIILVSSMVHLLFIQDHYRKIDKAQWREAAQIVKDRHDRGVLVYSNQEWWYNFYFYHTQPPIKVIGKYPSGDPQELRLFIELVKNERQFWLLAGEGMDGLTKDQMEFVLLNFNVKEAHTFFASSAILFDRKQ